MNYEKPELYIHMFCCEDVITGSTTGSTILDGEDISGGDELDFDTGFNGQ